MVRIIIVMASRLFLGDGPSPVAFLRLEASAGILFRAFALFSFYHDYCDVLVLLLFVLLLLL